MILTGENPKYLEENLFQCHFVITNSTSTGLGSSEVLFGKRPENNSLSVVTASLTDFLLVSINVFEKMLV